MPDQSTLSTTEKIKDLIRACQSMMIASVDTDSMPLSSYAPFLCVQKPGTQTAHLYSLISNLSQHTHNLKARPHASLMLIEDEKQAKSIYARARLTLACEVKFLPKHSETHKALVDALAGRHGETVELLRQLPDFHLVEFRVTSGQYVQGFGQAFKFKEFRIDSLQHQLADKRSSPT